MLTHLRKIFGMRMLVTIMLIIGIGGDALGYDLDGAPWFWATLLGVGLFASTFGIALELMRATDWRVVVKAVTVGVLQKAIIIGGGLWLLGLIFGAAPLLFLALGLFTAQMDPVAMAALADKRRMSQRADSLARAVAALDDPVTVLLTVLLVGLQKILGFDLGITITNIGIETAPQFGEYLWLNFSFMAAMVLIWQLAYKGSRTWKLVFTLGLISGAIVVGSSWYWMFGLALMGIYLRPEPQIYDQVNKVIDWSVKATFAVTAVIAGSLLFSAYQQPAFMQMMVWGLALGVLAFVSQMIVGPLMMWGGGYSAQDRAYFACSHTNGLTATTLGVTTGTIAYIIPGVMMTHIMHAISLVILNRRYPKEAQPAPAEES